MCTRKMAAAGARGVHDHSGVRVNGFDDVPRPFLIGVGGGTASGKSTVCSKIMESVGQNGVEQKQQQVVIISLESFYRPILQEDLIKVQNRLYNFDHPSAFDEDLMLKVLKDIKCRKTVHIPTYDYIQHRRKPESEWQVIYPVDVILFEGILVFYFKEIREMFNLKLFVDTDADTRLSRRVIRDTTERQRDLEGILHQYTTFVKPAFEEFCLPTKKYADVIIPRGADNTVAIDLIVQHIQDLLKPSKHRIQRRIRHNSDSLMVFRQKPFTTPH